MAQQDAVLAEELLLGGEEWDSDDEERVFAADDGSNQPTSSQHGLLAVFEGDLLDPSITVARDDFCQEHCCKVKESTPDAEQQELFKLYQDNMESAFKQHLADVGAGGKAASDGPVVSLQQLAQQLREQAEGACDEEVAELLLSVSDITVFVAMLEDFKQAEAERAAGGGPLELQGSKAGLHAEEQEEGEERPDLDKSLSVTAINSTPA